MTADSDLRERNLTEAFAFLDAGGDGFLTEDDLMVLAERVCKRFGLAEGERREAIIGAVHNWWLQLSEDCAADGDRISGADFAKAMTSGRGDPQEYFRQGLGAISVVMAQAIDQDGDGFIELEEYVGWFATISLSRDVVVAAFERLDADGDGRITHAEFVDGTEHLMLSQDAGDPGTAMLGQA
ncbi:MAG TPA: EF-hand domain-containing protein [Streptomyces sp.]